VAKAEIRITDSWLAGGRAGTIFIAQATLRLIFRVWSIN
jgi:hypothetical protein